MSDFDNVITRANAEALIPEEVAREIIQDVPEQSAALKVMRRLPNMSRKVQRMPVLSLLPTAYFVDGEGDTGGGLVKTSEQRWENKFIYAEKIGCIVPIPEDVLDDSDYPIWPEVKPRIGEAIGKVIDLAIFFGTNAPSTWPDDILTAATAAGNVVSLGTGEDVYDDIMGESGVIAAVEADGYFVDSHVAALTMRSKLRGLRSADGVPLFVSSMKEKGSYELDGAPVIFPRNGGFTAASALLISGDSKQAVYSIRRDMTFKVLTEGVIQDDAGAIVYNLAQQSMVALMCTIRLGWALPNTVNAVQATEASRYPFGVLTP